MDLFIMNMKFLLQDIFRNFSDMDKINVLLESSDCCVWISFYVK